MYDLQAYHDVVFTAFYGGVTVFYLVVCLYLLFRRGNAFSHTVQSPREVRYWAAAVVGFLALSNVWWVVLEDVCDDLLLRNAIGQGLDGVFLLSTMMSLQLRMLQDRRRPLWTVALAVVPVVVIAVVFGLILRNPSFVWMLAFYIFLLLVSFSTYMIFAVRQYSRWLRDNYADLENKEAGLSLVLVGGVILFYFSYLFNFGETWSEYLSMAFAVLFVIIALWRVELLQNLDTADARTLNEDEASEVPTLPAEEPAGETASVTSRSAALPSNIADLLQERCVAGLLYLRSDLTLEQLSRAIGTNRTYLSHYFTQQGITYNAYINRLRVEHFIRLYRESLSQPQLGTVTAQQLAFDCGFRSYRTFSDAFKLFMGQTVTVWMKRQQHI